MAVQLGFPDKYYICARYGTEVLLNDASISDSDKLLIYALGRGLDHRDDARIDQLMERLGDAPSLRRMILEIIESQPFLHRYAAQDAMMEAGDTP